LHKPLCLKKLPLHGKKLPYCDLSEPFCDLEMPPGTLADWNDNLKSSPHDL